MITMRPNGMLPTMGYEASDEPPKPMSDDEIGERVAAFRAGLVGSVATRAKSVESKNDPRNGPDAGQSLRRFVAVV
jgi:hypothetical protein